MKALLPLQTQPAAVPSREVGQDNSKQLKPEQPKQRQRRLFLQATSEDESESVRVPIIAKHASVPVQNPAKQRQAAVPKQQQQQQQQPAKVQGQQAQRARPVSVHEDTAQEVEDDDVPATYNNMPVKHKQSSQQASDGDDASHEEADAQEVRQASSQQKKKRGHQKQQPAQVVGKDLDFAASDAESDEYEPTQAKAAAKAAAKKAADKAAQPQGAKGKPRQPKHKKQQGTSKQPHNVAEAIAAEGPAKRPRGRPRKAPQEQQLRQQASKRKAAEDEEEEVSDEEVLPIKAAVIKAAVKPKAKQGGRLKRAALMSEANEDAHFHVNCCTLDHSSATATRFTLHSFPACSHHFYDSLVNL